MPIIHKLLLLGLIALCNILFVSAHNYIIYGVVTDNSTLQPISRVNVVIKHRSDSTLVAYATTSDKGSFSLSLSCDNLSDYTLQVSCIGYEQQTFIISDSFYSIKLKESVFELQEFSVKADKIVQNKDTTSYLVTSFATPKDRTIGDVLTNMPGINMADNGMISYNGSPVTKFYIEGIDLFDGKYNIATNNINYDNIARVDVIENHQAIKALNGSGIDTGTAINLKLKDSAKSVWNGNFLSEGGLNSNTGSWVQELFAAKFAKDSQTVSTFKTNNSGKNITDEGKSLTIDDLLYMFPGSDISGHITSEPSVSTGLNNDRSRFNCSYSASNSSMWKMSESAQINAQVIYSSDKNNFDHSVISSYYLVDSTLVKETAESNIIKDNHLQTSMISSIDKEGYYLSNRLTTNTNWRSFYSRIAGDFYASSIADINTFNAEDRLKYVKRIGRNVFQIFSFTNYTLMPEKLKIIGGSDRFQSVNTSNLYSNTSFRFLHKVKRWSLGSALDLYGNYYKLSSSYDGQIILLQNDLNIRFIGSAYNPDILYQTESLKLNIKLPLSVYHFDGELSDTKVYFKPDISIKWRFLPKWTLFANAAIGNSHSGNSLYYTAPVMKDYKSMNQGLVNYDGKKEINVGGRLSYANPAELLFAHVGLTFSDENTRRTLSKQVNNEGVFYSYGPGDNNYKIWFVNSNVSKGIDFINGTIELSFSWQNNTMPIDQNNCKSIFDFGSMNTGIILKSNMPDWINADYKIGYKSSYMSSEMVSTTTQHIIQHCLLTFYPTERNCVKINGEHYLTFFDSGQKKTTYFVDVDYVYRYKRFDIIASVTNLFNQNDYFFTLYGDLSSTTSQFRIRGRNIFVGFNWYY